MNNFQLDGVDNNAKVVDQQNGSPVAIQPSIDALQEFKVETNNHSAAIHFQDIYRADFMTQRAQRFLKNARDPFLLVLSYLEVHHQNDIDAYVPPKEFAGKFRKGFVPQDLRPLPGSWMQQLGDYHGCVAKMDQTVGII